MLLADFTFGNALLTVLEIFLFTAWLWILFGIFGDLFRDHELSGWGKAGWVLLLFVLPFLGVLIYLIVRGKGMRDRAIAEQAELQKHLDTYVKETAGSGSAADELKKLGELKDKGAISDAEFAQMKAKLLA
jgi:hypothetical protein